jgi:hypothetical protein
VDLGLLKMAKIYVHNSFLTTGMGIIAVMQHNQTGLLKGSRLFSLKTNLSWEIISRIFFDHTMDEQIRFDIENIDYMNLSFKSTENRESSFRNILENEKQGIFQYRIKPIGHDKKPENNEELEIKTAENN